QVKHPVVGFEPAAHRDALGGAGSHGLHVARRRRHVAVLVVFEDLNQLLPARLPLLRRHDLGAVEHGERIGHLLDLGPLGHRERWGGGWGFSLFRAGWPAGRVPARGPAVWGGPRRAPRFGFPPLPANAPLPPFVVALPPVPAAVSAPPVVGVPALEADCPATVL